MIVILRDRMRSSWRWCVVLWIAALVVLGFLYLLPSMAPPTAIGGIELNLDKLFHLVAHGSLMMLPLAIIPERRLALIMAGVAIASAIVFECGQLYVPQRSFGFDDMTANLLGAVLGALLGRAIRRL